MNRQHQINESLKRTIREIKNSGGDWRLYASQAGVTKSTAYRWISDERDTFKRKGGALNVKVRNEQLPFLEEEIENNPLITLKDLTLSFNNKYGTNVTSETIRRHLDGLMYTLKEVKKFINYNFFYIIYFLLK